ncbi:MAG: RNA polymerase sigma factor [Acidimicrobiia bacterium]
MHYRAHRGAVLAYLLRRCPSAADAHDALAETFLVAWRRPEQVPDGDAAVRLWLYGVARRVLANQRRAERRRRRLSERLQAHPGDELVPGPDEAGTEREVLRVLSRLGERDREILLLSAWEGLSHAEIAAVLGCSENASAVRLHRARARLREAYAKERGARGTSRGEYGERDSGKAVP